ncbi:TipJ family phage tail tip protein [Moraxella catarrhalis]|uniref:TipJ family phage tail tip protein n=2 Tax=Moraxella catarrhalis TaxID=480 RepID=UPI001D0DAC46|nr:phage tail protein [Moraxella catarrhalis]
MNIYGAKRQKQSSNKPYIQKDTASSTNSYQALYGLSEGEIYGLVDGGKSIRLDGTPIINDNGEPNFPDVSWDFRAGSIDQEHIKGFSSVENEQSVNVELRHDRPYTKAINNKQLSAVAIRLGFNSLREQKGNGDVVGYRIEYAIDVQTDGGAWEMVLNTAVDDKVSQGYQRSHRIDLPKAQQGWSVRVRRLTPNRDSEMVSDTMVVSAVTEIIDAKLRYPCTALLALKYDAQTFSNIAKVAVHVRGMLIQVPTNYDPTARTYDGLWDGTFKLAYTNNPAWVFYDICTAKRYGLGDRLAGKVDKWSLYRLAQYCDEMVDDGKGGKEPRFTVNVYLQKADDAYRVLQNLASVFRALSFWDGTSIVVDADTPKEPVYVFSNANVIGGEFSYTGTRARDRHTIVKCAYDDPDNNFETDYIYVQDEHAIAKYGINQLELNLFGCTSKGQAQRAGIWALKSEQLETETVSFSTGLDGFIPKVGEIIHVQDNSRAGRMQAGRIVATDGRQITLDRMAGKVGDTLMVGDNSAQIVQIDDTVITTDTAIGRAGQVFAISSSDVAPRAYRVMTISQNDDASFSFTALQYEIGKFTATNNIAAIPKKEVSVIKAHVLTPPNSVSITERTRTHQGQAITTLVISWEQVVGAVAYIVEYKKDSNAWQTHKVSSHSLEIDGVYAGAYQAKVRAIDAFDNESLSQSSQLTAIQGKQGKPPRPINLSVQGVLFGMNLGWNFAKGSGDTNFTEIEVSPDGRTHITTLGTFAYPTNKHEITGLQGNLTQFYRARIVDKLGNTSDWTDWVSGTTSADADKVLDMLSGQISQSHLDQSLRTPIGKIGTIESNINSFNSKIPSINKIPTLESAINSVNSKIPTIESNINSFNSKIPSINKIPTLESAVNSVNGNLSTLNSQLATAQNELSTAKSTLQTAVGNITTERNRITAAIFDINALQADKNAKTQEIANLTQTVGSHTSSIRELGVATGDLSQKYGQIKTQADNTNSEITAIKQTQSGQATSVERLGARFDNLSAGGRNLIINSGVVVQNDSYPIRSYPLAPNHGLADGDDVVITIWGQLADSKTAFYAYNSGGWVKLGRFSKISDGVYVLKTPWAVSLGVNTASNTALNIYPFPQSQTGESRIDKIKLERGNIATDWTAAPEDLQEQLTAQLANKASTASVNTLNQTLANKERALTEQINTAKSELANKASSADLQSVQRTLTSKERSLSQRINTLQSDYNGNKASVQSSINTLTTTNQSLSERINTVESSVSGNTSSINTLNQSLTDKERALTRKQEQLTAQLANKASSADLQSVQQTLTTKEQALTEQINTAKSELGGRITQISDETRTLSDANRTIGERINRLDSEIYSPNLLQNGDTPKTASTWNIDFPITESLQAGRRVYISLSGASGLTSVAVYNSSPAGAAKVGDLTNDDGVWRGEFDWVSYGNNNVLQFYREPRSSTQTVTASLTTSNGSKIANLERTVTTNNQSLSERINTVESSVSGNTSSINTLNQSLTTTNRALTTKQEQLTAQLANKASTSSVNSLSDSLATKERALSRRIGTVESSVSGNTSSINTLNQSLTTTNRALTTKQEQLTAQLANKASTASVNSLTESLASKERALSRRIGTVESSVSGNTSSINTLNQSLTTTNRALTTKQEQLTAQLANKASTASVNSLTESLASKERALTEQINRAKSEMGGRITQISNETRTLTDANRTIGERINQLNSELAGADSISDNLLINSNRTLVTGAYLIATYRISETLKNGDKVRLTVNAPQLGSRRIGFMAYNSNSASGSKLSDIRNRQGNSYTAEFEWNVGTGANNELWLYHNAENTRSVSTITSVSLQKITTGSGLASIKSSVANLERTLTTTNQSLAERINTVQTTLNGQTASIQQHAQSLNGLSAQWTLKVQSGGVVSGIGLASNNGVSDFAVRADKFYVASPQGNKKPMFSVITRPTTLNGTTVPTGVYLNGDLLASGTISGDKIRANTQITAPNIRGGSINIGSNFSVDSQGNLNANSGVFRGQVFADKITGQIDVESLKSSAVALGYDMFISNSYHASSPSGFDKTFKASYPSHGSIIQSLGFNNENIGSAMYEMRVFCKRAITVKQKLHTVDDNLYCYVNGDSAFGYHSNYDYYDNEERVPTPFGRGRINTEISLSLRQGLNTIQFVLNNSGGGICQLIVLGDFIDNNIIKFA